VPRDVKRDTLLSRRAALLAAGQGMLGAALVARLYQLQILESDRYTVLAEENGRPGIEAHAVARRSIMQSPLP